MSKIDRHTRLVQALDVLSEELDDELVMMRLEGNVFVKLDAIGTTIWTRLQAPTAVVDVCAALVEEFEVSMATCQQDVFRFLDQLYTQRLVRIAT